MKIEEKDLRENIEQLIFEGVFYGEEVEVTTDKVMKLVWTLIDFLQTQGKVSIVVSGDIYNKPMSLPVAAPQRETLKAFGEAIVQKMHNGEDFNLEDEVEKFINP